MSDTPLEPEIFDDEIPSADREGNKPAPVGDAVLSDSEIERIKKLARENVQKQIHKAATAKALAKFEEEARVEAGLIPEQGPAPVKERVSIRIDVPKYVPWILLDRKRYFHGYSYDVTPSVAETLIDQMQHTWRQEQQTEGKWFGPGHQQQNVVIGRAGDVLNTSRSLRR